MNLYKFTKDAPPYSTPIFSKGGFQVSTGFSRIVHGGRGAYVEFLDEQMVKDNLYIPSDAEWRLDHQRSLHYLRSVYYIEYAVKNDPKVKVYFQKKIVDYADYVIGRWYISPTKLKDFEVTGKTYDLERKQ